MPIKPEDETDDMTTPQRIPRRFNQLLEKWSDKMNVPKTEVFRRLADLLDSHDIDDIDTMLSLAEKVDKVGASPAGAGTSSHEMKDAAITKMWSKIAMEEEKRGMNMERIMELMMLKQMMTPPQPGFAEMMMVMMQMQMASAKDPKEGNQMVMQMYQDMQRRLDQQQAEHRESMREVLSAFKEKDTEDRFRKMEERTDELFDRSQENLKEAMVAMGDNLDKILGELKSSTESQMKQADTKQDQFDVAVNALQKFQTMQEMAEKIGAKYGIPKPQVESIVEASKEKTGVGDYMNNLAQIFNSASDLVGKLQGLQGQPGNLPMPDSMQEEAVLRDIPAQVMKPQRLVTSTNGDGDEKVQ